MSKFKKYFDMGRSLIMKPDVFSDTYLKQAHVADKIGYEALEKYVFDSMAKDKIFGHNILSPITISQKSLGPLPLPVTQYNPIDLTFKSLREFLTGEKEVSITHRCEEVHKKNVEAEELKRLSETDDPSSLLLIKQMQLAKAANQKHTASTFPVWNSQGFRPGSVISMKSGSMGSAAPLPGGFLGTAIISSPEDFDKIKPIKCGFCTQTIEASHIKAAWWRAATQKLRA